MKRKILHNSYYNNFTLISDRSKVKKELFSDYC